MSGIGAQAIVVEVVWRDLTNRGHLRFHVNTYCHIIYYMILRILLDYLILLLD